MLTKRQLLFFTIIALLATSGCNNTDDDFIDKLPENTKKERATIIASIGHAGGQTKTTFDDKGEGGVKQTWAIGDKFDVYTLNGRYVATYILEEGEEETKAFFSPMDGSKELLTDNTYTAVYPSIENTPTLDQRARNIYDEMQNGNTPLGHIDKHCYMNVEFTYIGEDATEITFAMEHTMITVKMEKPDGYDSEVDGKPVNLTFYNGHKSTSLTLEGITNWEGEDESNDIIIAYMIVEPMEVAEGATRDLYFDLLCENGSLYQSKLTSSKSHKKGMRYTADLTGENKLVWVENENRMGDSSYTWVITDESITGEVLTELKTELKNAGNAGKSIRLILPNATTIAAGAFSGYTALQSVSMPKVTTIAASTFSGCTGLQSVSMPMVTTIGNSTFLGCTKLPSIVLPKAETIGDNAFSGCTALQSVNIPEAKTIGNSTFSGCTTLPSIVLPKAKTIGNSIFSKCSALSSISLPVVTTIGDKAFDLCIGLTTLSIATDPNITVSILGGNPFKQVSIGNTNLIIGTKEKIENNNKWRNQGPFKSVTILE